MTDLTIKPADECRWDLVALGEVNSMATLAEVERLAAGGTAEVVR